MSTCSLGQIQVLVMGGSDKRPPSLSNCYFYLASPFFTRKSMVLYFPLEGSTEPPEPPLDPPQIVANMLVLIFHRNCFKYTNQNGKTKGHKSRVQRNISPWLLVNTGGVSTIVVCLVNLSSLATWQAVSGLSPVIIDTCQKKHQ